MKKKIAHLRRRDPVLRKVIDRIKLRTLGAREGHFKSLVEAIISQQLSGKAAATITKRFKELFPRKSFPGPQDVLRMPRVKIRRAGLSAMKVSFLKDLSRRALNKSLDLRKIGQWSDEEVVAHLVRVRGIGRWTAEMFLMFSLRRDDVFSYGDLGLRNAMKKLYGLKSHPTEAQAEKISSKWKPYRTWGSRYLWASLGEKDA
ncbi:MAG: hypothetical protein A3A43_00110 [Candidatus Liptonbacteria bacterium RIFCSPLOWO2_01_FULL_56_20]|uniref:DNA-3-methyladenine glycosylase II n=1 Tax=Candidatus Liptonbacteria bacterium RIFCSPLOWO2_01_FULL_56_20 TaxID=1798652 RepID=A0A1G2CK93_9BACT|nr:MAG: HhH-GPD family protein [Parcubacteria group bacterium GW2011_GWB1_56_8]OGY97805.1 MAG: hypothetical protein A2681_01260 [Candidatus Liptonbacteria bacterium RIFCSPHIGHO2_01_FULL_56_18b]OGZ01150.1 MAG: hypothetical protein A3A43_00110 [Candidatus Liptonbacteria bacterium RIFCSPLOWO2_01_FULL_56_20]